MRSREELVAQASFLRGAHSAVRPLVLPNAWDVASAVAVEGAGFPVIATSSSAITATLGETDSNSMSPEMAFGVIRRISNATSTPITADIEAGYGLEPDELAGALIDSGAVGCNFEDSDHSGSELVAAEIQADRIRVMKDAALEMGVDLVINARIDSVVRVLGSQAEQDEAIRERARLYLDAGADCIYPIMLSGSERIGELVRSIGAPININVRRGGESVSELTRLGVARISLAGGLFRIAQDAVHRAAKQIATDADSLWE